MPRTSRAVATCVMLNAFKDPARQRRWVYGSLVVLALAVGVLWLMAAGVEGAAVIQAMNRLGTGPLVVLAAVLPVAGFPISMVYLLIGARFGPVIGLGIVGGVTAVHLLGTHWIARGFLREPLLRLVKRRGHHVPVVPPGENAAIALMVMLAPAIPYFVRNYVLALSGIPLRIYLWVALPIHVLRSYVALFLGEFGSSPSRGGLVFLGIFYSVKLALFAVVAWWLRARHKRMAALRVPPTVR